MILTKPDRMNAETITNPVKGDRMTILQPAHESQGRYAKICFDLPPGAQGSPLHYHTEMDETFTVLKGCLTMEVGQKAMSASCNRAKAYKFQRGHTTAFAMLRAIG